jgi:isopenicillin-N N-acyltransferase-like protein
MQPAFLATRREFLATFAPAAIAAAPPPELPAEYPLFRASGTYRELGRQHGEQASGYVQRHLDYIQRTQKLSKSQLRERALRFEPLFARYCPHLLEEIQGLAEGAGIEPAGALAVNIRGELGHAPDGGCTAYVIGPRGTANGELLAGQNSDMGDENIRLGYVLHLKPRGKPEVLIWTFGGMIGYHGVNSAGVAQFANALGGGPPGRFAMPHYPVKRMMLECAGIAEVVDLFEKIPLASNGNYVLCDGDGAFLNIEATTAGPQLLSGDEAGFLAHTNHFLAPAYATAKNLEKSWRDSVPRLERMNALLTSQFGALSVQHLKAFLSDHSGHPTGICRHDGASRTVAGIIAEPARRRMHVAAGHPCQGRFVTYSM